MWSRLQELFQPSKPCSEATAGMGSHWEHPGTPQIPFTARAPALCPQLCQLHGKPACHTPLPLPARPILPPLQENEAALRAEHLFQRTHFTEKAVGISGGKTMNAESGCWRNVTLLLLWKIRSSLLLSATNVSDK